MSLILARAIRFLNKGDGHKPHWPPAAGTPNIFAAFICASNTIRHALAPRVMRQAWGPVPGAAVIFFDDKAISILQRFCPTFSLTQDFALVISERQPHDKILALLHSVPYVRRVFLALGINCAVPRDFIPRVMQQFAPTLEIFSLLGDDRDVETELQQMLLPLLNAKTSTKQLQQASIARFAFHDATQSGILIAASAPQYAAQYDVVRAFCNVILEGRHLSLWSSAAAGLASPLAQQQIAITPEHAALIVESCVRLCSERSIRERYWHATTLVNILIRTLSGSPRVPEPAAAVAVTAGAEDAAKKQQQQLRLDALEVVLASGLMTTYVEYMTALLGQQDRVLLTGRNRRTELNAVENILAACYDIATLSDASADKKAAALQLGDAAVVVPLLTGLNSFLELALSKPLQELVPGAGERDEESARTLGEDAEFTIGAALRFKRFAIDALLPAHVRADAAVRQQLDRYRAISEKVLASEQGVRLPGTGGSARRLVRVRVLGVEVSSLEASGDPQQQRQQQQQQQPPPEMWVLSLHEAATTARKALAPPTRYVLAGDICNGRTEPLLEAVVAVDSIDWEIVVCIGVEVLGLVLSRGLHVAAWMAYGVAGTTSVVVPYWFAMTDDGRGAGMGNSGKLVVELERLADDATTVLEPPETVGGAFLTCAACHAPAKKRCPTCREKQVPAQYSMFCSEACMKRGWSNHKKVHKEKAVKA